MALTDCSTERQNVTGLYWTCAAPRTRICKAGDLTEVDDEDDGNLNANGSIRVTAV